MNAWRRIVERDRALRRWLRPWVGIGVVGFCTAAAAGDAPVCTTRDLGGRLVFASGRIDIAVAPARVYEVVTDFKRLPEYVSAIDSTRVLGRDSLGVLVRQVGTIHIIVRRPLGMTLRFVEEPPERLRFEITSGDFPIYYGSWEFLPSGTGTVLRYTVTMRPPSFVPTWLVRPSIERTLCRTLLETRREAERREILAEQPRKAEQGTSR